MMFSMPDAKPTTIASCGSILAMNISPMLLSVATKRDSSEIPTKYLDSSELMDFVALRTLSSSLSGTIDVRTSVINPFSISRKNAMKTMENTAIPNSVMNDASETIRLENVPILTKSLK